MFDVSVLWQNILYNLDTKISTIVREIYFDGLKPEFIKNGTLYLSSPSKKVVDTINDKYLKTLIEVSSNLDFSVFPKIESFKVLDQKTLEKFNKEGFLNQEEDSPANDYINHTFKSPKDQFVDIFTFDNFVIGNNNKVAFAAAKKVAEDPGQSYNPLFIYGDVGLGKTHLLHSIGNYIVKKFPNKKVLYVTTEQYVYDFVSSLRKSKDVDSTNFRKKYRDLDVLLVDDIQGLKGKTTTEETFFHTFNDLARRKKQVVFTSDKHPKDLSFLSNRLRSRFLSGLSVDITKPSFETRLAILQKKCIQKNYIVPFDVLTYMAENFDINVRELEGLLNNCVFYATITERECDSIEIVEEFLKEEKSGSKDVIDIDIIINAVTSYFNISKDLLIGKKRNKEIVYARHIAMFLISDLLSTPLVSIGDYFKGRDRTAVSYALNKIQKQQKEDKILKSHIKDIKAFIYKK